MKHPSIQQIPRTGLSRKKIKRYTVRHLRALREKGEGKSDNRYVSSSSY